MLKRLTLTLCLIFLLLAATPVSAQPQVAAFYGSVKSQGKDVPDGTVVSAWIEGEKVAETLTSGSKYVLKVVQPEGKYFGGKTVRFKVGDDYAVETGIWKAGELVKLDLNVVVKKASISLSPSVASVRAGHTFEVSIIVDPQHSGVSSVEVEIGFDPRAMEAEGITPGPLLGASPLQGLKEIDNKTGRIKYALARRGATLPPTPKGNFVSVKFRIKQTAAAGRYTINILRAGLADENFKDFPLVEVSSAAIEVVRLREGDVNGDGMVDYRDLAILGAAYGTSQGGPGFIAEADLNGDGIVDYKDLAILGANYRRCGCEKMEVLTFSLYPDFKRVYLS